MTGNLRAIFNEDAELYTRARPGYPAQLFIDLAGLAGVGPGRRVLEIGPGTGQATLPLAELGARVTAVELGPDLAAELHRRVSERPDQHEIDVLTSAFEDWPLPAEPFHAVTCFTAWHWLTPHVRAAKAATALAPGGALATVTTSHILGGTVDFFARVQACYERWDPATEPGIRLQEFDEIPPDRDEVDQSPAFEPAVRRRYRQDLSYSAAEYLDVLSTYSGHRALPAADRAGLLADIGDLIDHRFGGRITKAYGYELRVTKTSG